MTFFLTGTDELRKMARQIFEPSLSSDSPVNFMCNNMGFLKNLLSSDFGGHFFIFGLYFIILSPDEIDVLPWLNHGTTSDVDDFQDQEL